MYIGVASHPNLGARQTFLTPPNYPKMEVWVAAPAADGFLRGLDAILITLDATLYQISDNSDKKFANFTWLPQVLYKHC